MAKREFLSDFLFCLAADSRLIETWKQKWLNFPFWSAESYVFWLHMKCIHNFKWKTQTFYENGLPIPETFILWSFFLSKFVSIRNSIQQQFINQSWHKLFISEAVVNQTLISIYSSHWNSVKFLIHRSPVEINSKRFEFANIFEALSIISRNNLRNNKKCFLHFH